MDSNKDKIIISLFSNGTYVINIMKTSQYKYYVEGMKDFPMLSIAIEIDLFNSCNFIGINSNEIHTETIRRIKKYGKN